MVQRTLCSLQVIFICIAVLAASGTDDYIVVKKDFAKILRSPYGDSQQMGLAVKGDRYKVKSQQGDWYSISYNNSEGWIYSANISLEHKPSTPPPAADSPSPAMNKNQASAPVSPDTESSQKIKAPPSVHAEKNVPSFAVSEVRARRNLPRRSSAGNTISKSADTVEKIVSEMAASADSSRNNRRLKADSVLSVKIVPAAAPVQKYFEILESPAKILTNLNPQSPILAFAKKNDVYPLVYSGASWCKIVVKNDTGWVELSKGRIVDSPSAMTAKIPAIVVVSLLSAGFVLVLIFVIIFIVISLRRQKFKKSSLRRDVLIISHSEKEINYSLTDTATTLSKCFSEIGFKVSLANGVDHARTLLVHYAPDVIVIDWQLEKNIQLTIGSIVSDKESTSSILIIFYNVPDPTETTKRNTAPTMFFLGLVFSDRDIFKIVTPLIMTGKSHHTIKKSVQTSALEGDIRLGNLLEVMQFIEIGRKTGCLYITVTSPFGLIYFEQGRITYAASKEGAGKDAIFDILDLKEGHFHLILDKISQTKNVNLSTLEVLMDWTKVKDEALRR
jgi:Bacterial SH3 domain.